MRYQPAPGWGVHAAWNIIRYLRVSLYFVDSHHDVELPQGALRQTATFELDSVKSYSFGARLHPSLQYSSRGRIWQARRTGVAP